MKRVLLVILSLLVLSVLVVPTLAAHMSVSASATQLHRGDTVSFTISVSTVENCKSLGFDVSYDSSVFEWQGGSVLVSGTTMGDFSGGTASAAFAEPRTVSGSVFRFTLRVKDSAPLEPGGKSLDVSGSASVRDSAGSVSCSAGSVSLTLLCNHEYGAPVMTDDSKHTSTCPHCGDQKVEDHSFADKTIHQEANCKEPGSKTVECTACHHTLDQDIPVNENHDWGACSTLGLSKHTHTCNRCQKKEDLDHRWDNGWVAKVATCTQTGQLVRTCKDCGGQRTDEIPMAAHSYTPFQKVDDNTHTHSCTVCNFVETVAHTYAAGWQHDAQIHFLKCDGCGFVKENGQHVPGPEPTDDTPQICTVCSRMLRPSLNHEHVFRTDWSMDDSAHWHSCESCIQAQDWQEHVFSDACDESCNVCDMERAALHVPESIWSANQNGHWKLCQVCGQPTGVEAHIPGPAATVTEPQHCTVCSYITAPVLEHDPVFDQGTTIHYHTCVCGERVEADAEECGICLAQGQNRTFPWWIICVAEAAVLGVVILALALKIRKLKREKRSSRW